LFEEWDERWWLKARVVCVEYHEKLKMASNLSISLKKVDELPITAVLGFIPTNCSR
jgi:hypothetical protein